MADRTNQEGPRSAKSGRFEALLDTLVAVQMDLEAVCGVGKERVQIVASLEAIADLRNIIYEANGLTERPEAVYG